LRLHFRSCLTGLLLFALLCLASGPAARAQSDAAPQQATSATTAPAEKARAEGDSNEEFRHAPKVEAIARIFHVSTETAAEIFEDLNSGILIFAILFLLFKLVPKAIRARTATIQKQLIDARSATEIANERLSAVEAKLARIGDDIEAIRLQTEREMVEDEKRIKQSLEDERQRIVQSAEQEIASAGAAAQRGLKRFAAGLAIDSATRRIQITAESDKELIERFGADLARQFSKGERN
jgi:F-type H+-transporting ATPase subunit b